MHENSAFDLQPSINDNNNNVFIIIIIIKTQFIFGSKFSIAGCILFELSISLPEDVRFRPPIGNGHVATNVLSDTIYMNGLFNGHEDYSSRARIQSTVSVDIKERGTRQYSLDMYEGKCTFYCVQIVHSSSRLRKCLDIMNMFISLKHH